jgi:hypothetical protein
VQPKDLCRVIEALPAELAVWHAGPDALPRMLSSVSARRITTWVASAAGGASPGDGRVDLEGGSLDWMGHSADEGTLAHWRHPAMTLVEWHATHGHAAETLVPPPETASRKGANRKGGRRPIPRRVNTADVTAALELAKSWEALGTILTGLRTGDCTIQRHTGRHIWVSNHRRSDVEVLDIVLGQVTVLDPPDEPVDDTALHAWFKANRGRPERLDSFPQSLRQQTWNHAAAMLEDQGTTIADTVDLGGLTLGEARACYALLIAQLYLNELCTRYLLTPRTLLWAVKEPNLVRLLSRHASPAAARAFIDLCRYGPGRSPLSAPLVPSDGMLLIPHELVSPIAFERTLLRASVADPGRAGKMGNLLGSRSRRWVDRLSTIPGCKVAERVLVRDPDGVLVGDLDVVAWDEVAGLAVIVEAKWPVDAATLSESYKVDAMFASGREQVRRLRGAMDAGRATPAWPKGWAVAPGTRMRWWVASAQQLDSTQQSGGDGVGSTSLRLVEQLLPKGSLEALVEALDVFPMPRQGVEYELVEQQVDAGPYRLHFDALQVLGDPPVPPPERRLGAGWT